MKKDIRKKPTPRYEIINDNVCYVIESDFDRVGKYVKPKNFSTPEHEAFLKEIKKPITAMEMALVIHHRMYASGKYTINHASVDRIFSKLKNHIHQTKGSVHYIFRKL